MLYVIGCITVAPVAQVSSAPQQPGRCRGALVGVSAKGRLEEGLAGQGGALRGFPGAAGGSLRGWFETSQGALEAGGVGWSQARAQRGLRFEFTLRLYWCNSASPARGSTPWERCLWLLFAAGLDPDQGVPGGCPSHGMGKVCAGLKEAWGRGKTLIEVLTGTWV